MQLLQHIKVWKYCKGLFDKGLAMQEADRSGSAYQGQPLRVKMSVPFSIAFEAEQRQLNAKIPDDGCERNKTGACVPRLALRPQRISQLAENER